MGVRPMHTEGSGRPLRGSWPGKVSRRSFENMASLEELKGGQSSGAEMGEGLRLERLPKVGSPGICGP